MVKKISDVTVTKYRGRAALDNVIQVTGGKVTTSQAKKTAENLKIRIGEVIRFYPGTDKISVKLLDTNQTIRCVLLHSIVSGECNVSFMPMGSAGLDTNYNEHSIIPYNKFYAAILDIKNSQNEKEYCCIGFLSLDDTLIKNNAERGEYLIENDTSKISVKQGQINIDSKQLFLNGNEIIPATTIADLYVNKHELNTTTEKLSTNYTTDLNIINGRLDLLEKENTDLKSRVMELETKITELTK